MPGDPTGGLIGLTTAFSGVQLAVVLWMVFELRALKDETKKLNARDAHLTDTASRHDREIENLKGRLGL
jgi:hypothetical protein